jgi:protein phosphatase 2C family protein 2/3
MTVLIVAILGGRTKEEWYSWITDRVKQKYGYDTPTALPQIYAQSRLMAYKARREAQEERDRMRAERAERDESAASSSLGGFSRILGSTGGISFHPSGGISGGLMFATDDSDDDEDDEDEDDMIGGLGRGQSLFSDTLGIGRPRSPDVTLNLKAQLDDFEKAIVDNEVDGDTHEGNDEKGDAPFGTDGLHEGAVGLARTPQTFKPD